MRTTANEASRKVGALNLIPLKNLSQATRVKVIRASVEYDKVLGDYQKECEAVLNKLKPEEFDERMQKYAAALNPTADNREEAEKQRAEEGFKEFKAEYDKVDADYREIISKLAEEPIYTANPPSFTDADFEDIAKEYPSGGQTELVRNDDTKMVGNDEILANIIAILA